MGLFNKGVEANIKNNYYLLETNSMASNNNKKNRLVYLTKQLRRQPCQMLVDCGSTKNSISIEIANWLRIKTKEIKRGSIYLTDD